MAKSTTPPSAGELQELVEKAARAMQIENRPKNDCRNSDQRHADEATNFGAYKALAEAALEAIAIRTLIAERERLRKEQHSLEVEALSYRHMHDDALALGYPSILEALEDLERIKTTGARHDG
jgi:hypothetical protein